MVSWTHPEKAVSRLNSDALVTQLPSSSLFIHGKDAQNIQCKILKGHSDIFSGCSFAIPPFLIYKLIIR